MVASSWPRRAPQVAQVGLNHVAGLFFEDLAELKARHQSLAARHRNRAGRADLGQGVDVLRWHWHFDKKGPLRRQCDRTRAGWRARAIRDNRSLSQPAPLLSGLR